MEIVYTDEAIEDLIFWKASGNISIQKKIKKLIESIKLSPTIGIGKPEPLNIISKDSGAEEYHKNIA